MKNQTQKEKKFFEDALKNVTKITDNETLKLFYEKLKNEISKYEANTPMVLNHNYHLIGEMHFMFRTKNMVTVKICDYIKLYEEGYYNITIIPCKGGVEIERLEVYKTGKGIGSFFGKIFNSISLENDIPLYLIPGTPGYKSTYRDDSDDKRRREFYHRLGFKRMKSSLYWQNTEIEKIDLSNISLGSGTKYLTTDETNAIIKWVLEIQNVVELKGNNLIDDDQEESMIEQINQRRNADLIDPLLNQALQKVDSGHNVF